MANDTGTTPIGLLTGKVVFITGASRGIGAAIQQPGPLDSTSEEDIDEQFAVNFRAHWTAMTAEAALMRRDGGGAIVNNSSIGSRRANPALPAYGAMKRALQFDAERSYVRAQVPPPRRAFPDASPGAAQCPRDLRQPVRTGCPRPG